GKVERLAVPCLLARIKNHDVKALAARYDVAQPGEKVGLHETNARLVQVGILPCQPERFLVQVDADDFLGFPDYLGINGKTPRIAAEVQNPLARAEAGQGLAIIALVEKKAGLVFAAR